MASLNLLVPWLRCSIYDAQYTWIEGVVRVGPDADRSSDGGGVQVGRTPNNLVRYSTSSRTSELGSIESNLDGLIDHGTHDHVQPL